MSSTRGKAKHVRIVCDCGGEVPRPLPPKCPHCGKLISVVHRPRWAWLWPAVVIGGFFALLVGGALLLVRLFGG